MTDAPVVAPPSGGSDPNDGRLPAPSSSRPVAARLLIVGALLLAATGGGLLVNLGRQVFTPTPTPSALEILARVRAEVIPAEDSDTGYGPAFNYAGYQTLLSWNKTFKPSPAWADAYEAIDITLPCCGAAHPNRDERQNCGCGHHQAAYGVTKYLLQAGYSVDEVQVEVNRWKAYMFPKETLAAEMERRAVSDPAIQRALEELKANGQC